MLIPYIYKAKITNVVDGDTVDAIIDVGFKVTTLQRLRLLGIDAPELNSKDLVERASAQESKLFLIQELLNKDVLIKTEKSDSFGRYLATICVGEVNINEAMLAKNLATPYK